ncbi:DUF2125 domain-containing protein [Pseudoprimorskyibacter insulae]|uniref:DUF2125 domain-containing protein n=1 Tax=Pseudoprimorskyibacter insulae TaxID=1695997 RepID=A0A2R8AQV7_9RHOB|nr:DUF2125 domain-containing protein [Pseudoprimorskyibacter insulae]SPF78442.1 hypothetical protein PRI8871_01045 [Pseudoprimorskyibacter insulae]
MLVKSRIFSTTALTGLLLAQSAAADITPAEVWDELHGYLEGFGYTVAATETASGADVSVTGITIATVLPENQGTVTVTVPDLTLVDLGDGSVSVEIASQSTMLISTEGADSEEVDVEVGLSMTDMETIVSGAPGDIVITQSAASVTASLLKLIVEGEEVGRDVVRVDMTMTDLASETTQSGDGMTVSDQVMTAGGLTYDLAFADPEGSGRGMLKGSISDLAFEGSTTIPEDFDETDPADMFRQGFAFDGGFEYAGGQSEFAFTEDDQTTNGKTSSDGGFFDIAVSAQSFLYSLGATGMSLDLFSPEIPLPIQANFEEAGLTISMPLAQSDAPEPFEFDVTLGGFTMSDLLWNIFDPGQVLPRDPATIAVNATGAVRLLLDVFDEAAMEAAGASDALPAEIDSLVLNTLTVEAAGASLTGTGAFTFDNTDTQTFDGLPRPIGSVDLSLIGGYGLLDKLVQLGFVPEQDAMGARMMIGMFAVPGDTEDSLKSKVEINDQAHILVNGQRIQ